MKKVVMTIFFLLGLAACSAPEVANPDPNLEYNKGRQRAEMEGCHCNSDMPWNPDPNGVRQRKGWTDGYVEACIRFKKDQDC